jgi:hypothetical protein
MTMTCAPAPRPVRTYQGRAVRRLACLAAFLAICGCATAAPAPHAGSAPPAAVADRVAAADGLALAFLDGLRPLCGMAFDGTVIHAPAVDTTFAGRRLVMHVMQCDDGEIRIPFHVGDDRSRTWVLRLVGDRLELKHIHRYRDGTEAANSQYGGTSTAPGTAHRQEFPADAVSIAAAPARATQWWFVEHYPGARFAYGLFRRDGGTHYRMEFDLTRPVAPPPPPW